MNKIIHFLAVLVFSASPITADGIDDLDESDRLKEKQVRRTVEEITRRGGRVTQNRTDFSSGPVI